MKGIWFVTSRRYVLQEYGHDVFERYVQAAPRAYRDLLRDPVVSRWYSEETLRDALAAFHAVVTGSNDATFQAAMERCTVLGVHWFLQILASVTTPSYLLRLLPPTLNQIRRGPVRVQVVTDVRSATLRFTGQPYADDPRYLLSTPAIVRSIVALCVGPVARARLTYHDLSTHVCEVTW